MKNAVSRMIDFHTMIKHPVRVVAGFPKKEERELRKSLLKEEYEEYLEAEAEDDLVETSDALTDMLVIILGTALVYGIDIGACFNEVMNTNDAKMDKDGTIHYHENGKVKKPKNWKAPNIKDVM